MKKIFFISSLLISLIGCSGENFADMQIEKPKNPQENPQNPITPNHKDSIKTPDKPTPPPTPPKPTPNTGDITVPLKLKAYYQGVDFTKSGEVLKDELATLTITKHRTYLGYERRHNYLPKADADLSHGGNVILVYTGESRNYQNHVNTEHIYPQSLFNKAAKPKGDLHHLRACDINVNSNRGNLPFTEGSGKARKIGRGWYPSDEFKGDVARMIMYMHLHYNLPWNAVSTNGIKLFLKWNAEDKVSPLELQRNNVIEEAQGNRNPFIDNPYLATKLWGGDTAENAWK